MSKPVKSVKSAALTLDTFEAALIAEGSADLRVLEHFKAFGKDEAFRIRFRDVEIAKYLVRFGTSFFEEAKGLAAEIMARTASQRNELETRAVNAAKARWSYWLARAGIGGNKKGAMKGANQRKIAPTTATDDNTAPIMAKPTTPANVDPVMHVTTQAAALLAFANKHAKTMPGAYKTAIADFVKAIKDAQTADK